MTTDALIEVLPDLAVLLRRDGVVLGSVGGHAVAELRPSADNPYAHVESIWPVAIATLVRQLTRKAISLRTATEARFENDGRTYEARVSPQGPDRSVVVIRSVLADSDVDSGGASGDSHPPQLDRRGFLRRYNESLSLATLCETPIALAIIQVEGLSEIARLIDVKVAEQIMSSTVIRLPSTAAPGGPAWYLGQLGENLLAVVLETADREAIEACLGQLCASVREPVTSGDAEFHLTPYVGVAVLSQDAAAPAELVDNARAAATEALRDGSGTIHFFSDGLRLQSLARLDGARELREAIANRDIRLHYVGRHDLATGRLLTGVGYLRWAHPFRGEVRPAEFVGLAETTGLAIALSRAALKAVGEDFAALAPRWRSEVRISFGALRHHILHEDFVGDMLRFLKESGVPPERLELRVAERTFIAGDPAVFNPLVQRGVQIVVDEVGRGMASFDRLARAPIWGLQLDRAWVTPLRSDGVAQKVCRAAIGLATALGITPIATGVDDSAQREALVALGCRYGSGDLYGAPAAGVAETHRARAAL
jgi:predicted signal transduction protein with EAL and GGDEF domain